MDWDRCIICQKTTGENLQCPAKSKRKDAGAGYVSFLQKVEEFKEIGIEVTNYQFPVDENQGIEQTLLKNKASWHKSCRDCFNSTKLQRAKKRKIAETEEEERKENDERAEEGEVPFSLVKSRRSISGPYSPQSHCFFCEEHDSPTNLHSASTLEVDKKIRDCAVLLNDSKLIAKLSAGDLIAIEAKYHARCLVGLYNRARPFKLKTSKPANYSSINLDELAFAELITYIDERLEVEDPAILVLSDLVRFYTCKLEEIGVESGKINATRLKERVLAAFPDLTAHNKGREIQLVSKHEIGGMLTKAKKVDCDAWCLARAAHIVRREVLKGKNSFNGTFAPECQKNAVPVSLLTLVGMMIKGPTTKIDPSDNQACLSIAQLIVFNSISRPRDRPEATGSTHHLKSRECPVPIYTALKIHGATRDRSLIDTFYNLGLCISYDRFLSVSTEITNCVVERYEREGVVCPSKLRRELFTTAAVDNIDHNTSSTSSQSSFHGTAISLVQHPSTTKSGARRDTDTFDSNKPSTSKTVSQLPSSYNDVLPLALPITELYAPKVPQQVLRSEASLSNESIYNEEDWLSNAQELIEKEKLEPNDFVSWAAFRASQSSLSSYQPAIISLLPMFVENAHSFATIAHSMSVIKSAVRHVNPSQAPVIALDQPLFAIAKEIQWKLADYNEDQFVLMLGGLHIEMASFKMIGKWMTGSGWTDVLCNAGVATQGVSESFLTASHIARTRRAHQVWKCLIQQFRLLKLHLICNFKI